MAEELMRRLKIGDGEADVLGVPRSPLAARWFAAFTERIENRSRSLL